MEIIPLILMGLTGLTGLLTAFVFVEGAGKRRLAKRARSLRRGGRVERRPSGPQLRRDRQGGFDGLIHRLAPRPEALRARLAASGSGLSIGRYGLISAILPIPVIGLLLLKGMPPLGAILVGAVAGLWIPHAVVGSMIKGRQKKFSKLFPEAIGLLVRGLKAGLPVAETVVVVGREVADPVGEEFRRVGDQVRLGQSIEEAMWATARRINLPEFNFLVITLSVQRETGGNLAETLENLDDILRKRQQMKLKVKAMSSEATASAGIIGSLPFVMAALMFVVSRDYIMLLGKSDLGLMMMAGGGAMLLFGVAVMVKMVSFEI